MPSRVLKNDSSAVRWQSALPSMSASFCGYRGIGDRARGVAELPAQVRTREVAGDPLDRSEEEGLVRLDRTAERAAELLAVESIEVGAVRQLAGQRFEPLEVEQRAVRRVRARLRDHVDDAAGRAAELGRRAGRDHLEFLDRVERDVDRRALPAGLLAEEAVVVVAAVEADVVEDPALTGERDLVAIRPLDDADAWGQGEEILELAAEDRQCLHRSLVERRRRRCPGRLDDARRGADRHRFGDAGHLHRTGSVIDCPTVSTMSSCT